MAFDYVDLETAQEADGLRMVVVRGVPSPWSESAKGTLHMKSLDWSAVYHRPGDKALRAWTERRNAPVLVTGGGERRSGWAEILLFAEAASPAPSLIPSEPDQRALMFGLAHEILGEGGLCWSRRLQIVDVGMKLSGPPREQAEYIGGKYGYHADRAEAVGDRTRALLALFAARLAEGDGPYYFGDAPTAVDIYSAAAMALFAPLPDKVCAMNPGVRAGFAYLDAATKDALDPALLAHRDMMYEKHLELPLKI